MTDTPADFAKRHGLSDVARTELERLVARGPQPVGHQSHANESTLMVDLALDGLQEPGGASIARPASNPYDDLGFIGSGSFSEVRRVRDKGLHCVMAMKILERRAGPATAAHRARFIQEARATAQLQHPAVVPVHSLGILPDGRYFFTMEEVRGRTLDEVVRAVQAVSVDVWSRTEDGWSLRRLVEVFRRVCEGVAYAHSRGVVHRDIKPSNVMVGTFGEVRVLDWGIAKVLGGPVLTPVELGDDNPIATRMGVVAGTPAYMAPEQALGQQQNIDKRTDVFALGGLLHFLLLGTPPFEGASSASVLEAVTVGDPAPLVGRPDGPMLPQGLVALANRAMAHRPDERFQDASALASEVADWLDGAERREAALRSVALASEERRAAKKLRRRAARLRTEAQTHLDGLPTHAPLDERVSAWEKMDAATRDDNTARNHALRMEEQLNAAFAQEAHLPEGHLMMARDYHRLHRTAEAQGDSTARLAWLLARHLDALAPDWPGRRRLDAYLKGDGTLSLTTERPATGAIYTYDAQHGRFLLGARQELGALPFDELPLAMGDYLLAIEDDEGELFTLPLHVARQGEALRADPDGQRPPMRLPEVDPDEAYVAAGWFRAGGDEKAPYALLPQDVWCEGFAIQIDPVTHADWVRFLQACEAPLPHVPRNDEGEALYTEQDGSWVPVRPDGTPWTTDAPVTHIDWHSASAYAAWRATVDGVPWRLPFELEWEKAARGVSGRAVPWGDRLDPSLCNARGSLEGVPRAVGVATFPTDASVYGVRGLGGNTADWCEDAYADEPAIAGDRVVRDEGSPSARFRSVRGGSWRDDPDAVRSASRWRLRPNERSGRVGLRLVRSID